MAVYPKIVLFCAHRWEAEPFIQHLGMHQSSEAPFPFPEFVGDEQALYLTGQGSGRAAAVTASVLARLPSDNSRVVANFGTAGTVKGSFGLGRPVLIHRVVCSATGRSFYPDRLVRADLSESICYTVPKPEYRVENPPAASVFDMELSGLMTAAELYLHSSQIVAGKVVSDYLGQTPPDWREMVKTIEESYRAACSEFLTTVHAQSEVLCQNSRVLKADAAGQRVKEALLQASGRFTVTQTRQLESALRARALSCTGDGEWEETLELVKQVVEETDCQTKAERSRLFDRLLHSIRATRLFSHQNSERLQT